MPSSTSSSAARNGATAGSMLALLGGTPEDARAIAAAAEVTVANDNAPGQVVLSGDRAKLAEAEEAEQVAAAAGLTVANDNAPGQIVLAGDRASFEGAEAKAGELGRRTMRLPVAGAFHSPSMAPAVAPFRAALDEVELGTPRFPVYSCSTAAPFTDVRAELTSALTRPVLWRETFQAMLAAGAEDFVETGPGNVLSKLARRITKETANA